MNVADVLKRDDEANNYLSEALQVTMAFNARFFHAETNQYDTEARRLTRWHWLAAWWNRIGVDAVLANLVADIHATATMSRRAMWVSTMWFAR